MLLYLIKSHSAYQYIGEPSRTWGGSVWKNRDGYNGKTAKISSWWHAFIIDTHYFVLNPSPGAPQEPAEKRLN